VGSALPRERLALHAGEAHLTTLDRLVRRVDGEMVGIEASNRSGEAQSHVDPSADGYVVVRLHVRTETEHKEYLHASSASGAAVAEYLRVWLNTRGKALERWRRENMTRTCSTKKSHRHEAPFIWNSHILLIISTSINKLTVVIPPKIEEPPLEGEYSVEKTIQSDRDFRNIT